MNLTKNQDEDISNWDEIKNFVGGAKNKPKHPLVQEMERMKQRQPEHFDDGGQVGMVPPSQDDLQKAIMGGLQNSNTPLIPKTPPPAMPPMPPPNVPRGTSLNMGPSSSISTSPNPIPSSQSYDDKASSILGGLDPAKISELLEGLKQQSNKSQIGAGIAGIGDAISSVGGVNGQHMKDTEEAIRGKTDLGLKAPELMANAGKEKFGLSQMLQSHDPNSPFSKVKQNSNRQLFKAMGAKDSDINSMSADDIDQVASHQVTLQEALARIQQEGAFQKGTLDLQKQGLENTKENQGREREEVERKERIEHPIMTGVDKMMNGGSSNFDHAAIPSGKVYQAPDGSWRKKQ